MAENPTQNGAGPEKRAQARKPPVYSEQQKANAVAIVQEHGLADAARRTSIPKSTLQKWAKRAGVETVPPQKTRNAVEASKLAWEARRSQIRDRLGAELEALIDRLKGADDADVPKLTTGIGTLIDKAELLSGRATSREEHVRRDRVDAAVLELEEMLNTNGNGHG